MRRRRNVDEESGAKHPVAGNGGEFVAVRIEYVEASAQIGQADTGASPRRWRRVVVEGRAYKSAS